MGEVDADEFGGCATTKPRFFNVLSLRYLRTVVFLLSLAGEKSGKPTEGLSGETGLISVIVFKHRHFAMLEFFYFA